MRRHWCYLLWPAWGCSYWLLSPLLGTTKIQASPKFHCSVRLHSQPQREKVISEINLCCSCWNTTLGVTSKLRMSSWNIYSRGDGSLEEKSSRPGNIFKVWNGLHSGCCAINYDTFYFSFIVNHSPFVLVEQASASNISSDLHPLLSFVFELYLELIWIFTFQNKICKSLFFFKLCLL